MWNLNELNELFEENKCEDCECQDCECEINCPIIRYKDKEIEFEDSNNFLECIIECAKTWELQEFKVVLNGFELEFDDDVPFIIEDGDVVTIITF